MSEYSCTKYEHSNYNVCLDSYYIVTGLCEDCCEGNEYLYYDKVHILTSHCNV